MDRSYEGAAGQPRVTQVPGRYVERLPTARLRQHVEGVWFKEVSMPATLEIIPDGCIDLYWHEGRLMVAGPNTAPVSLNVRGSTSFAGVRFAPGVAPRWLRANATELLNLHLPLLDVCGPSVAPLIEALHAAGEPGAVAGTIEQWLAARVHDVLPADPLVEGVRAAARVCHQGAIVHRLTTEYGWSERTLHRRCKAAFGYGPRTLVRILRFQQFLQLAAATGAPLSRLASESGYADQAHLTREARCLAAEKPSELVSALVSCLAEKFKT